MKSTNVIQLIYMLKHNLLDEEKTKIQIVGVK